MFVKARQHIAANTFQVYKRHITLQYETYKTSQTTNGNCDNEMQSNDKCSENVDEALQVKKKIKVNDKEPVHSNLASDVV